MYFVQTKQTFAILFVPPHSLRCTGVPIGSGLGGTETDIIPLYTLASQAHNVYLLLHTPEAWLHIFGPHCCTIQL